MSFCLPNLKEYKILLYNKQNNELLNNLYKQYWVLFCNIRLLVTSLHHILLLIKSQVVVYSVCPHTDHAITDISTSQTILSVVC